MILFDRFDPGDVLMVAPKNMPETADSFAKLLNIDLNQQFTLAQNDPGQ